jgi:hypothetical protein
VQLTLAPATATAQFTEFQLGPFLNWNYFRSGIFCCDGLIPEICPNAGVWSGHSRATLKPFRYIRDPLFVCSCALYALNRWALKPHLHSPFVRGHFNDLLLIPCAIPPLLLFQRFLRLRPHDHFPAASEILFCLVTWTLLFEWIGPRFVSGTTADPLDAIAYVLGGILAFIWWRCVPPARVHQSSA